MSPLVLMTSACLSRIASRQQLFVCIACADITVDATLESKSTMGILHFFLMHLSLLASMCTIMAPVKPLASRLSTSRNPSTPFNKLCHL